MSLYERICVQQHVDRKTCHLINVYITVANAVLAQPLWQGQSCSGESPPASMAAAVGVECTAQWAGHIRRRNNNDDNNNKIQLGNRAGLWSSYPATSPTSLGLFACTLCINKCAAQLNMQMQVLKKKKKSNLFYLLPLSEVLNELQINCKEQCMLTRLACTRVIFIS